MSGRRRAQPVDCPLDGRVGRHSSRANIEVLCRDFDVFDLAGRRGNRKPVFAHAFDVKLDGVADLGFNFGNGCASGDATRKVWNVGRIVAFCSFNHDGVSHMASLLEARLLQDAVLGARGEVIARLTRNSDAAGLG